MQALLVNCNLQIVDDLGLKDLRIAISRCNQCTTEWSWQDLKCHSRLGWKSTYLLVLGGMVTQLTLTQEIGSSTLSGPTIQGDSFNGKTLVSKTSFVGSTPAPSARGM